MKTIISICTLSIFLYACSKDSVRPEVLTDCMGVENGVATYDDCRNCHQSYIYNDSSHVQTYINDTTGLVLGVNEMFVLAGSALDILFNPTWNGGPLVAIDSCGDCHQSYIYNFVTHVPTYIDDTTGLVLDALAEMFVLAGSAEDIASNPNWNAGCK